MTNTHTSHTRAPTAPRVTIQIENTTSITPLTQTYNILQHSKAQNPIYLATAATQHTSIVSRHLATIDNNTILRTRPPHIISSEEILPRITRHTHAQPRTNNYPSPNHTYTRSTPNHINQHYVPSVTLTPDTHHVFNCIHIRTTLSPLDLWTDPAGVTALLARWTEKLTVGPQAGRSDSPPPLVRVMGVGWQQLKF